MPTPYSPTPLLPFLLQDPDFSRELAQKLYEIISKMKPAQKPSAPKADKLGSAPKSPPGGDHAKPEAGKRAHGREETDSPRPSKHQRRSPPRDDGNRRDGHDRRREDRDRRDEPGHRRDDRGRDSDRDDWQRRRGSRDRDDRERRRDSRDRDDRERRRDSRDRDDRERRRDSRDRDDRERRRDSRDRDDRERRRGSRDRNRDCDWDEGYGTRRDDKDRWEGWDQRRGRRSPEPNGRQEEERSKAAQVNQIQLYGIYKGRVNSLMEYGAFVQLEESHPDGERVRGKKEGMVHLSQMRTGTRTIAVNQVVRRNQTVFVKVWALGVWGGGGQRGAGGGPGAMKPIKSNEGK